MTSVFSRVNTICRFARPRTVPRASMVVAASGRRHMQQQVVASESTSINESIPLSHRTRSTRPVKPREERFDAVFTYLEDGLNAQRDVRKTTWMKLFQLAENPAQMERVVENFPRWRAMRKTFDEKDGELFARRCDELHCAPLALRVFADHPKHGLPLSHLAGLQLLHGLSAAPTPASLADTVTAAALLKASGHHGPEGDLPACAMLVAACVREFGVGAAEAHDGAKKLLNTLLPALKQLVFATSPALFRPPPPAPAYRHLRARFDEKPRLWLVEALERVQDGVQGEAAVKALGGKAPSWVGGAVKKFRPEGSEVKRIE